MTQVFDAERIAADRSAEPAFAAVLRDCTSDIHREAERSGYIADLLRGRGTRWGYALYLGSLLPVYEAMERHLGIAPAHEALRAFSDPRLFRASSLRHDIEALGAAEGWSMPDLPEAAAYTAAVDAQGGGIGLLAHAYARYLGDLSGGQILKPLLARNLDLTPEQLTFYDFPDLDVANAKAALRSGLDCIDPASADATRVADEAIAAFRYTIALSAAIAAAVSWQAASRGD